MDSPWLRVSLSSSPTSTCELLVSQKYYLTCFSPPVSKTEISWPTLKSLSVTSLKTTCKNSDDQIVFLSYLIILFVFYRGIKTCKILCVSDLHLLHRCTLVINGSQLVVFLSIHHYVLFVNISTYFQKIINLPFKSVFGRNPRGQVS